MTKTIFRASIPVKTITSFDQQALTRIIQKAYEARIANGKATRVNEEGLSCTYVIDIVKKTSKFMNEVKEWNDKRYNISQHMFGPGVKTQDALYIVYATEAFENELAPVNAETILGCYFDSRFINELVDKAYKKAKHPKSIVNPYMVTENKLNCRYVKDINDNDAGMIAAIHLWNEAQDSFRRMVIGKGLKTKNAIYVIYNDRYLDCIDSFWKFYI